MTKHSLFLSFALLTPLLLSSCATRAVPADFDSGAPASPKTREAPLASVTQSLDEDPNQRWRGLEETKTSTQADPHQHHHHGGHHGR